MSVILFQQITLSSLNRNYISFPCIIVYPPSHNRGQHTTKITNPPSITCCRPIGLDHLTNIVPCGACFESPRPEQQSCVHFLLHSSSLVSKCHLLCSWLKNFVIAPITPLFSLHLSPCSCLRLVSFPYVLLAVSPGPVARVPSTLPIAAQFRISIASLSGLLVVLAS